ncbi:hypothetical protein CVT25_010650 [Psilocybe cyanescens]|uniref:TauD/TfdA-like domain-containing protein n=1 Tax=Psilocybe cyanescens TaxID=93625 RepID=A0A409WJV1_PSICY|nr:hypothetical protein CVT25_010650 [Psilocybe cyanescens]
MAPSVAEIKQDASEAIDQIQQVKQSVKTVDLLAASKAGPSYPFYAPYYDLEEKFSPTELFDFVDPGSRADPKKPHLLNKAVTIKTVSPYLGTKIKGVQISELTKEGLDELALYAAERKVLIFRDQNFKDLTPERQIEIARHFGPIQKHPTSPNVKGYPEFHVVYRDRNFNRSRIPGADSDFGNRLSSTQWHSDVSYEKQPPGTTFFFVLDQPETGGGDTLFLSQVEAYNRLSPEFKKRLEGLRAVHSAVRQAEESKARGGPVRREAVESEHPIVRVHPVTGEKALYVNANFTRHIVGFRQEESDALLGFLYNHIATGSDFQIRGTYQPGTVVVWDNRLTVHSIVRDYSQEYRRHCVRLTPQAEVPIEAKA